MGQTVIAKIQERAPSLLTPRQSQQLRELEMRSLFLTAYIVYILTHKWESGSRNVNIHPMQHIDSPDMRQR